MKNNKTGRVAALVASMVAVSAPAFADEGVKVGGYVDVSAVRYNLNAEGNKLDGSLSFAEGAVTASKAMGDGMAMVLLPIVSGGGPVLGLAGDTAQAFIGYKYGNGLSWKLGQFAGIFGLERNYTNEVAFTRQGALFALQPKVHTGIAVGYDVFSDIGLTVYTGADDGDADKIGARVTYKTEGFSLGVGYRTDLSESGAMPMYLDVTAGLEIAHLGVELGYVMDSSGAQGAVSQMGISAGAKYELTEALSAGARFDMIANSEYADGASEMEITVGPQYAMSKDLTAKLDLTWGSTNDGGAGSESTSETEIALNTVYNF